MIFSFFADDLCMSLVCTQLFSVPSFHRQPGFLPCVGALEGCPKANPEDQQDLSMKTGSESSSFSPSVVGLFPTTGNRLIRDQMKGSLKDIAFPGFWERALASVIQFAT